MIRTGILVFVGLVILSAVAWSAGYNSVEVEPPTKRQPTEAERIIAYCSDADHKTSPLCSVDPDDSDAVRDAVRDAVARQQSGPQIIERERITERDSDEDDDQPAPRVTVVVPRQPATTPPRPAPTRTPTRPPMIPEIRAPELPVEVPNLNLPLLP